jgi:hypothetical protein
MELKRFSEQQHRRQTADGLAAEAEEIQAVKKQQQKNQCLKNNDLSA